MFILRRILISAFSLFLALLAGCGLPGPSTSSSTPTRTIIMVWDGMRPDLISSTNTPNLFELQSSGVNFTDNHSTFPTFTMMNSSSFATGSFPSNSGFYGNTFWLPYNSTLSSGPSSSSASATASNYIQPIFTEDFQVLNSLNNYYSGQLLLVKSLFATAQASGMTTAAIGKAGAAYLQDLSHNSYFLDENSVLPCSLITELQAANFALPANTVFNTNNTANNFTNCSATTLASNNGSPTNRAGYIYFPTTAYDPSGAIQIGARDPSDSTQGVPEDAANKYMMSVFTQYILPQKLPMLSLIWFRTPDNTEHGYGPGTYNAIAALKSQDQRLGELIAALRANNLDTTTNIVVVSDHGHTSVSGPLSTYPLRAMNVATTIPAYTSSCIAGSSSTTNGTTTGCNNASIGSVVTSNGTGTNGYSFSGDVRTADLLTYRGFAAYDGTGCSTDSMYGLDVNGVPTVPVKLDVSGSLCGSANTKYQAISGTLSKPVANFLVPAQSAFPTNGVVIAANGGSDYLYIPSHDTTTVTNIVKFLQTRPEYGAIFVDSRYGSIAGTLQMKQVNLENATRQNAGQPDIIVSFNWDYVPSGSSTSIQGVSTSSLLPYVQGVNGIEYESFSAGQHGMHGSFGIGDVHNTLVASGPSFLKSTITNPTGNVDVAPTVAYVLGLSMPNANGRIINEALKSPASNNVPVVTPVTVTSSAATGLTFELPTDPTGATKNTTLTGSYSINLQTKQLTVSGSTYTYFDYAQAVRK